MERAIDVFFYGLFMDRESLSAAGFHPGPEHLASVDGFQLQIGARATLVPAPEVGTVWGMVMSLPADEVARLYGEASVADYRPEEVLATLPGGKSVAALCYNLPADKQAGTNKEYAASLHALAARLDLPADYVSFLNDMTK
jgi:hypothetical protein